MRKFNKIISAFLLTIILFSVVTVGSAVDNNGASYIPGDAAFDTMYKSWFDSNIIGSYFDKFYSWTRLGYTYDWADNGTEYGLSEFLIFSGAKAFVEYTYTVDEYISAVRG